MTHTKAKAIVFSEYESALKDLLEEMATLVEEHYLTDLESLYMPQNVPGADKISVKDWLDARWIKRNYPAGPQ